MKCKKTFSKLFIFNISNIAFQFFILFITFDIIDQHVDSIIWLRIGQYFSNALFAVFFLYTFFPHISADIERCKIIDDTQWQEAYSKKNIFSKLYLKFVTKISNKIYKKNQLEILKTR